MGNRGRRKMRGMLSKMKRRNKIATPVEALRHESAVAADPEEYEYGPSIGLFRWLFGSLLLVSVFILFLLKK